MRAKKDDRPLIVVIDDEPDFLDLMERSLRRIYRVTTLFGSDWTCAQVAALEPDLVLLDAHMPVRDGFDICRELRENPRFAWTPIVFLTASTQGEDFKRHLSVGGTRFVNKLIDRKGLLEVLNQELAAAAASR